MDDKCARRDKDKKTKQKKLSNIKPAEIEEEKKGNHLQSFPYGHMPVFKQTGMRPKHVFYTG